MKETKTQAVERWFLNHPDQGFTTQDCLRECHTTELRKIVCKLINRGLNVCRNRWLEVGENEKVKLYYVTKQEVERYCKRYGIDLNELQWYNK